MSLTMEGRDGAEGMQGLFPDLFHSNTCISLKPYSVEETFLVRRMVAWSAPAARLSVERRLSRLCHLPEERAAALADTQSVHALRNEGAGSSNELSLGELKLCVVLLVYVSVTSLRC